MAEPMFPSIDIFVEARPGTGLSRFLAEVTELSNLLSRPIIGKFNDRHYPAKPGMTVLDLAATQLGAVQRTQSTTRG